MMKVTLRRIEEKRISEHCCHIEYQLRDSLTVLSVVEQHQQRIIFCYFLTSVHSQSFL